MSCFQITLVGDFTTASLNANPDDGTYTAQVAGKSTGTSQGSQPKLLQCAFGEVSPFESEATASLLCRPTQRDLEASAFNSYSAKTQLTLLSLCYFNGS